MSGRRGGPDLPVPPAWCYQCGGLCREVFAGDEHLPAHPVPAAHDASVWLMVRLSNAQAEDAVWLRALAQAAMIRAWRNERPRERPPASGRARRRAR